MEILIVLLVILAAVLYVYFSTPKSATNPAKREGRNSSIYCSSIRNSYPPTKEVFEVIEEANVPPCFSRRGENE